MKELLEHRNKCVGVLAMLESAGRSTWDTMDALKRLDMLIEQYITANAPTTNQGSNHVN